MNTKKLVNPLLSAVERAKAMIAAEKEAKAPTIMTRSGITDLANRVRQSEGQYGAQRVERAADEIPNLEKLYQDQALMRAFTGDNAQAVMTMKPSDFERYAAPLGSGLSDRSLQNIIHLTDVQNRGGFSDVPYLNINKKEQGTMGLPYISGHEGRHRNRAMDAAGEQAGLVQLVPRSELREPFPRRSKEEYLEALYKEMQLTGNRVKPEAYYLDPRDDKTYQRKAIELPDFYAQGGMVDSAPEEAIKNTITDPQAFRMLDMDLANLALMNQPQRMAGGGAVNMDEGGLLQRTVRAFVPSQVRTFVGTLAGDESPITEKNFSGDELDQMRKAIMSSRQDRTAMNARLHHEAMQNASTAKERRELFNRGPSKELDQTVGYQHYQGSPTDLISDFSLSSDAAIRNTLGRFAYEKTPEGNLVAKDLYKFRGDQSDKTRPTSDYADMGTAAKLWALTKDTFGDAGLQTLPSRTGNAFLGNKPGRPVNVNLGKAPFAQGGVIHMGKAGAVTDAVKALEKARNAGRVESMKQQEAKLNTAMSKYANGERLSLEEVSLLRLNHPAGGGVNLSRLPSEYSAEYDMERTLEPKKIITPQSMVGGASVPLVGDSAAAGKRLIAVDGSPLSGEVNLDGGSAFMRDNQDAWSSGQSVVSALDKQIGLAYQGADKVYGPHVSMSGTGGDFNAMTTNTLLNMFDPADISAGDAAIFNNRLRTTKKVNQKTGEITYPYADFVGIHHPDLRKQLLSKVEGTGNLRSGFVEEMNKGRSRELGFPEPASARFATSDRALLDKPIGSTGYDIAEFAPNSRIITNPKVPHGTYPVNLAGDYAGSFQDTVPANVYFKDFYEGRRLLSKPTSSDTRAFTMSAPIQYHDQAWLDNIMKYITERDAKVKLGGYAEGGAVHMAEGGQVQRFDEGGEVSQSELDRMRFEIAQQQNPSSPVMQATPRSPIQNAIGTFGGFMDRAGKFVSEAIAPTAEKHPVKHFLADLLLAESLKSAGTALQDYTGTARETDEDNPVRGLISKNFRQLNTSTEPLLDPRALDLAGFATPVVKGVTKLANVGAKAITPFASKVDDMVREMYATGAIPQPGLSIKDTTPKALAPANEQGFYSPVEAAALNLQRKTGNGQQFLNDILKGDNVRSEEVSNMGLDTFLKDKKNVTAAEVQDYIAQNKLGLGEATYVDPESIYAKSEALNTKIAEVASKYGLRKQQFGSGFVNDKGEFVRDIPDDLRELQRQYVENRNLHPKTAKFGEHSLPGGENYREVVINMPPKEGKYRVEPVVAEEGYHIDEPTWKIVDNEGNLYRFGYKDAQSATKSANELNEKINPSYRSSHWDEPNVLAHLRMSDRVTDGKKTLLVDEVQSDWHQAARDARTLEVKRLMNTYNVSKEDAQKAVPKDFGYKLPPEVTAPMDSEYRALVHKNADAVAQGLTPDPNDVARARMLENQLMQSDSSKIPDAPYKDDYYQLALRRAVKEAIDGGYDRVALPTGARVAERFDLSKQISEVHYSGTNLKAYDLDGNEVISQTGIKPEDLPSYIGKEAANKLLEQPKQGTLRSLVGQDLKVGGEGMKKYYDEIYPTYLKKFGKKYGANVGTTYAKTDINEWPFPIQIESDGKNFWLHGRDPRIDKEAKLSGNFNSYEDANKFRDSMYEGNTEPLHYMEITPAMRKEFSTGIHMKRGGKVSFADSLDAMRHELTKAK